MTEIVGYVENGDKYHKKIMRTVDGESWIFSCITNGKETTIKETNKDPCKRCFPDG